MMNSLNFFICEPLAFVVVLKVSHGAAQAKPKLMNFLAQPPQFWGYTTCHHT